jgi:hypothetical protein
MKSPLRSWATYAAVGLVVVLLGAGVVSLLVDASAVRAVWTAAAIAYTVQLIAFALLVALHGQPQLFMMAWLGGMLLRFGALGACAFWVSRNAAELRGPTLLSLVGFLFLLLLLEPLFLRRNTHGS